MREEFDIAEISPYLAAQGTQVNGVADQSNNGTADETQSSTPNSVSRSMQLPFVVNYPLKLIKNED